MSTNDGKTHYAAVSCDDSEKWGYSEAYTQRLIEIHSKDGEQWTAFHAVRGEIPTVEDLKKFKGVIISGSPSSANDNIDWILKLQDFIRNAASLGLREDTSSQPKITGICFGHQLIAKALGGKVGINPDKDFVLQTEEIKAVEEELNNELTKDFFEGGSLRIIESHSECVTQLPEGAVTLASSESCQHEIVKFTENILGVQSHPELFPEEVQRLILPSISKRYNWSEEKLQQVKKSFQMDLKSDRMNKAIKKFLSE